MKILLKTLFKVVRPNTISSLLFFILIGICNAPPLMSQDTDNDGVTDLLDSDDDNDGISDITEGYQFYTDGTTTDTTTGNCTGLSYDFTGGSYIAATGSGAGTLNAEYRFPNTAAGLDAIIKIVQISPNVTVVSIDQNLGDDRALQPVIRYPLGSTGDLTIQFLISFVLTGTNTSATVDRVGGFIQDIDSDTGPGIQEFFRVQNIVGYSIGNPTTVIPQELGGGVIQFEANGTGSAPIEPIDIGNLYRIFFQKRDANQFLFTIGAKKTKPVQATRFYSIRFDECRIDLFGDPSHVFFNPPNSDTDGIPDYLDDDSDGDGCLDVIEAGYIDSYAIADRDGKLGVTTPPLVNDNGLVTSGVNGQGYILPQDLNSNGIWDFLESAIATACDDNDEDGIPDPIDIDDDNDGIPDTTEGTNDTDGDGVPNYFDLDADNDGISDVIEGGNRIFDTNNDGVIDILDTDFADANNNGQADATEGRPVIDTDTDGIRDAIDLDADNDGIYDVIEAGNSSFDTDANGRISTTGPSPENTDTNTNGWADGTEGSLPNDTGDDNSPDYQNLDSDADGCNDANEAYNLQDASGADGEQYGTGNPAAVNADGSVIAAAYDTGIVLAVTDAAIFVACENIDPVNDVLDANDDDYSDVPIDGIVGGHLPNTNVLDNDTLNDIAVLPSEVTITSNPTGQLTVNPDGTVTVAPNTPAGNYTIDYTICEVALPDNCDTATVVVEVAVNTDVYIDNEVVSVNTDQDVFVIHNIEAYPNNTFEVYNRWGVQVFNTKGYNNVSNAFKGVSNGRATINAEEGLPVGVYFYVLNYLRNGENKTLSGYLYVNRL